MRRPLETIEEDEDWNPRHSWPPVSLEMYLNRQHDPYQQHHSEMRGRHRRLNSNGRRNPQLTNQRSPQFGHHYSQSYPQTRQQNHRGQQNRQVQQNRPQGIAIEQNPVQRDSTGSEDVTSRASIEQHPAREVPVELEDIISRLPIEQHPAQETPVESEDIISVAPLPTPEMHIEVPKAVKMPRERFHNSASDEEPELVSARPQPHEYIVANKSCQAITDYLDIAEDARGDHGGEEQYTTYRALNEN
ncbi:hypothetical protein N7456_012948 [Penicillium angulare]|uniref:Uncharacterized protein n=1 Tax=Penicillium angulare TaxID=116970 RepID=A0A9W9JW35_9EURO|nr:hypothetical protein N7456_012948 [Penicillium angulare]